MAACRASSGWIRAVGPPVLAALAALHACAIPGGAITVHGADPQHYVIFDPLFLQRNQAAKERPLAVSSTAPQQGVIAADDLVSTIGTGARLVYGDYGDGIGWEAGYVGVWGMDANRVAQNPAGTLQAAGDLGFAPSGLADADIAQAKCHSSLDMIEINVVLHEYDGGYNRRAGRPTRRYRGYDGGHLDWLAGVRWAGFGEQATLGFTSAGAPGPSTYRVDTYSNLVGVQAGLRGRIAFERWAFEGWMKAAITGTSDTQSQSMFDQFVPDDPYRGPRGSRVGGMGMIADMNLSAVYRLNDVWGLRVGYNLLWVTGVALAPDQWDFSALTNGGRGLDTTGSVFLAGANLGLEARW